MLTAQHPVKRLVSWNLVLLGLVTALFFLNFYQRTFLFRPTSYHQWRQADCLSITKNYYEEGMQFFHPTIHYQGVAGGKAVGECPILNYTAAALWKVFGEHELIYRLMEYLIFLVAVFVLFNTLLKSGAGFFPSLFVASVLLTSPLLVFYAPNFIADVPALSLAVISFCSLYRFSNGGRPRQFYMAIVAGTLAVLMKASALIPLCLTLLAGLEATAGRGRLTRGTVLKKWPALPAMALSILAVAGWYRFAVAYNDYDRNNIFLLTVLPVWEMEQAEILHKLKILFNVQFPLFLNKPMFFLVFLCSAYVVSRFRQLEPLLKWAFVLSGTYFICYLLFFFWVFDVHDYYLINIFIFPVVTLFCTVVLIARVDAQVINGRFAAIFIPAAIVLNGFHAAAIHRLRMIENDPLLAWFPFVSKEEVDFANYLFWNNSLDVKRVEHFTPALRSHGITRYDTVLSIPDHSFNVTLYLMDQKGYTVARDHIMNDTTVMNRFMNKVDYIVLSDTTLKDQTAFRRTEHFFDPIFTEGPVKVYKMKRAR